MPWGYFHATAFVSFDFKAERCYAGECCAILRVGENSSPKAGFLIAKSKTRIWTVLAHPCDDQLFAVSIDSGVFQYVKHRADDVNRSFS
jgi:hypothetical protein